MSPSIMHPKCAMAWGGGPCERCGDDPWRNNTRCLQVAAYNAQMDERLRSPQSAPEPRPPVPPPPRRPTPSTPPTGAVAPLPWRFEGMSVLSSNPDAYGPVASYVDDADGAFIIQTANHHAALMEALEGLISEWAWMSDWEMTMTQDASGKTNHEKYARILAARALLARVRGEPGNGGRL